MGLAALSVGLTLWQWYAANRFPLHSEALGAFAPSLSILRPLKGCDSKTEACLKSWFDQRYPAPIQLLFGVADEADPVCEIVRRLMRQHPAQPAELVICKPILGANAKVSSLCYLAKRARYEHLVISDQDVLISEGFLATLVKPLEQEAVGLVNCFYILAQPGNLPMRLEAVAVNADFWSQVLQGNMIKPMDFALGAVMATKRQQLDGIGGFETLLNYLADDYQLGNRIARTGARLVICSKPVQCHSDVQSAAAIWRHQLRWARTVRVCQPMPYFLSILSNGTLWPLLALLTSPQKMLIPAVGALCIRILSAWSNNIRLVQGKPQEAWGAGLLAPLKDLLQVPIWALAFSGNTIVWRDQRFHVDRGGKLTPLA